MNTDSQWQDWRRFIRSQPQYRICSVETLLRRHLYNPFLKKYNPTLWDFTVSSQRTPMLCHYYCEKGSYNASLPEGEHIICCFVPKAHREWFIPFLLTLPFHIIGHGYHGPVCQFVLRLGNPISFHQVYLYCVCSWTPSLGPFWANQKDKVPHTPSSNPPVLIS